MSTVAVIGAVAAGLVLLVWSGRVIQASQARRAAERQLHVAREAGVTADVVIAEQRLCDRELRLRRLTFRSSRPESLR